MKRNLYNKVADYEAVHWWFKGRRKIIEKSLKFFIKPNTKNTILEISCGSGGNLKMLSKFGKLSATEMDAKVRKIAQQKKICPVHYGKLPDELSTQKKDIICIFDVLEHVQNDKKSLQTIRTKLNKDGLLIVTVPALMSLWSQHDVVNHHKRRYTKKILKKLLQTAGYQVIYSTYFNFFLFPLVFLIRFFNRFKKKPKGDLTLPTPIINSILTGIFSMEKLLIPRFSFPIGVSLLFVAKKI